MTSVVAFGAVAFFTCPSAGAATAAAPFAYLTIVLIVHAASAAVIGVPSDHFVPERRANVHVLPSFEVFHDFAQSPWIVVALLPVRVLDELRVDHDHGVVGLRLDELERVERVDVGRRADRAGCRCRRLSRRPERRRRSDRPIRQPHATSATTAAANEQPATSMDTSHVPSLMTPGDRSTSERASASSVAVDPERQRGEMLAVAEGELVDDGDAERLEVALEHVLDRLGARPLGPPLLPVALVHVADDDADDAVELPGLVQLGQHPVHVPGGRVHVLEEEDAAVERDLPRRPHRLQQQPEAAADDRRGDPAAVDRAHVRVVRVARHLARAAAAQHREQAVAAEVGRVLVAHAGEPVAVEGARARRAAGARRGGR